MSHSFAELSHPFVLPESEESLTKYFEFNFSLLGFEEAVNASPSA